MNSNQNYSSARIELYDILQNTIYRDEKYCWNFLEWLWVVRCDYLVHSNWERMSWTGKFASTRVSECQTRALVKLKPRPEVYLQIRKYTEGTSGNNRSQLQEPEHATDAKLSIANETGVATGSNAIRIDYCMETDDKVNSKTGKESGKLMAKHKKVCHKTKQK